ncbi:MAG TPA: iron ABC transporter permease [Petrotogaceae bacterium]|mgnify:FL=1|jgi:iron complex transport system permease protein|nr:iron ABC transporter permease [Petrotogaceae bacterium]HQH32519.1 iron ABC transporter permease [Petrotogaceae bacterium]
MRFVKVDRKGFIPLAVFLLCLSFLCIVFFSSFGTVKVPFSDVLKTFLAMPPDKVESSLILRLRIPRIIGSFLAGAVLAVAGNSFQLVIQNPLADPFIIGISSGASFGAVLFTALTVNTAIRIPFGIEGSALIFSILTSVVVFLLAKQGKKIPILSLVLSGVIISFLLNSLTTMMSVLYWKNVIHVNIWLLGSTADFDWPDIAVVLAFLLLQLLIVFLLSRKLDVLSMNEDLALYSGINPDKLKLAILSVNIAAVSVVVSKSGIIGFVGLIIPHLVRSITGPYSRISTFYCIFIGGIFLSLSDFVSRTFFAPTELPIGVMTSLVGAPVFIYIMKVKGKKV